MPSAFSVKIHFHISDFDTIPLKCLTYDRWWLFGIGIKKVGCPLPSRIHNRPSRPKGPPNNLQTETVKVNIHYSSMTRLGVRKMKLDFNTGGTWHWVGK